MKSSDASGPHRDTAPVRGAGRQDHIFALFRMNTSSVLNWNSFGNRTAWLRLFMNTLARRCMTGSPPSTCAVYISICHLAQLELIDGSKLCWRAIACKGRRHLRHSRECGLCNLQNLKEAGEFEVFYRELAVTSQRTLSRSTRNAPKLGLAARTRPLLACPAPRVANLPFSNVPIAINFALRSSLPPAALSQAIERVVHGADGSISVARLRDVDAVFAESVRPSLVTQLVGTFAALAVLMAAIGTMACSRSWWPSGGRRSVSV